MNAKVTDNFLLKLPERKLYLNKSLSKLGDLLRRTVEMISHWIEIIRRASFEVSLLSRR